MERYKNRRCRELASGNSLVPIETNKSETKAPEALALASSDERAKAQKFYFLKDAKLSLGSSLLKRLYAVKALGIPWSTVELTRKGDPTHGKPALKPAPGSVEAPVDFNVSHQAGLVALAGCATARGLLGVDITCANERNDRRVIDGQGFDEWIEMHEQVFSGLDLAAMKARTPGLDVDGKIRRFYAYWCLKEAYVKLEGEALLAGWLKDVEFRNVRVPFAAAVKDANDQAWGDKVAGIEVWINGVHREDVTMILQAFGEAYLIGTAIKLIPGVPVLDPSYVLVDPTKDIYPLAEKL